MEKNLLEFETLSGDEIKSLLATGTFTRVDPHMAAGTSSFTAEMSSTEIPAVKRARKKKETK
jgi:hypothetical protein